MTTLTARIYHNESAHSFLGVNELSPAQLREVARFDIDIIRGRGCLMHSTLERIFAELNAEQPTDEWAIHYRTNGNPSLSVGDVVVLGEMAWACATAGWSPISTAAFTGALNH